MATERITTAKELRALAMQIRKVAEDYESVAKEMEEGRIEVIPIKGIQFIIDEVLPKRLAANAGSAQRALRRARQLPDGKSDTTSATDEVDIAAEAAETYRKVARRRKKKNN